MKIVKNVLTENTLESIHNKIKNDYDLKVWKNSILFWQPSIRIGNHVGVLTQIVNDELASCIEKEISQFLPKYNRLVIQIYLWPKGSNISWHNDKGYFFGATIYLNNYWEINYGGLFIWEDNENKELKVLCPSKNVMVINDKEEGHCVTHVTSVALEARMTLQIWGI